MSARVGKALRRGLRAAAFAMLVREVGWRRTGRIAAAVVGARVDTAVRRGR